VGHVVTRTSADLIEAMRGDAARAEAMAWPELVSTVRRQMGSLVGSRHGELEDLTQAALERVVVALPRFEGRAQLTTFTYRICAHVAMSHWRGWRRWARRFQFWTDRVFDEPSPDDAGKAWIEAERARRLHACIERLSPMKRVCVTLADLEDLPASRIAEIVGCPEPTVRSRLRAGRAELAAMVKRDPLFAIALGLIAWIAATGTHRIPPSESTVEDAPVVAEAREPDTIRLVVAHPCAACSRPLARGDRLAVGETVMVPAGETLVLCFALEDDREQAIAGPAEVLLEQGNVRVQATGVEGKLSPAAPSSPSLEDDPQAEWRAAQRALGAGDRASAERHMRTLVALRATPSHLHARASFALAELELARGAEADARARLEPLVLSRDASLAADAVFLLARASGSPRQRAAVYASYLAHGPPSPYREQALVDEALALLDGGDAAAAGALAAEVRNGAHVPEVVAPSLVRLERRLSR
jgi:RNA polymerase sigma-70 factor (ECF subfamily)